MKPVPLDDIQPRMHDIGRIRAGTSEPRERRDGSTYMHPIEQRTWVLSAQTPENLEILAKDYGGTIEPWEDDRTNDKFRVVTNSEVLHVVLPPNPLSIPKYEKWDNGFIRRRCNGVICTGYPKDGSPAVDVPCKCPTIDDDRYHCNAKIHLTAILPQTPIGAWRLVTTSMNAVRELKASVEIIYAAAQVGLPRGILTRVDRTSGEKEYRVPVVTTEATFAQIEAAGEEALALGRAPSTPVQISAPRMALPPGASTGRLDNAFTAPVDQLGVPDDDGIVDAEIVEDDEDQEESVGGLTEEETAKVVQMKRAKPKEPTRKAATTAKRPSKKTPAKKRAKTAKKTTKRSQRQTEAPANVEDLRNELLDNFLAMQEGDAEAFEVVLTAADLWPIDDIPDERMSEASQIGMVVIEAAKEANRL